MKILIDPDEISKTINYFKIKMDKNG